VATAVSDVLVTSPLSLVGSGLDLRGPSNSFHPPPHIINASGLSPLVSRPRNRALSFSKLLLPLDITRFPSLPPFPSIPLFPPSDSVLTRCIPLTHPVREDWWHQLCHTWKHYAFVVPFVWALNRNSKNTTYARTDAFFSAGCYSYPRCGFSPSLSCSFRRSSRTTAPCPPHLNLFLHPVVTSSRSSDPECA
jgi:hypothetical protein